MICYECLSILKHLQSTETDTEGRVQVPEMEIGHGIANSFPLGDVIMTSPMLCHFNENRVL